MAPKANKCFSRMKKLNYRWSDALREMVNGQSYFYYYYFLCGGEVGWCTLQGHKLRGYI